MAHLFVNKFGGVTGWFVSSSSRTLVCYLSLKIPQILICLLVLFLLGGTCRDRIFSIIVLILFLLPFQLHLDSIQVYCKRCSACCLVLFSVDIDRTGTLCFDVEDIIGLAGNENV